MHSELGVVMWEVSLLGVDVYIYNISNMNPLPRQRILHVTSGKLSCSNFLGILFCSIVINAKARKFAAEGRDVKIGQGTGLEESIA